ncbi:MAG TPA: hypothetical protein VK164_00690 [Flavobacterium sp.]|uniref:hypothetical protein n=1 Tax=Flavobacterium sp. TaxID=239 RepID=UPI002B4AE7CB|nr:hypothetical protein [Flavobacterium sp.]HLO72431.1 hypothetical protein [Flavobacterium sp.]
MNKLLVLFFMSGSICAQDTIVFPKIDIFKRNIIEVSYGKPIGDLADKYESSVTTAYYMRTKIAKRQFIDFGAELSGIVKGNNVDYKVGDENIQLDGSKSAFFLGFRYTRFLIQSKNENFHIETNTGIGWKYLYYSKPENEVYEDLDLKPALNTIGFSQGLKIILYGFGLHCNYQYAPYDLFNTKVEKNFGGSSINFGLSGSWNF